MKGERGKGGVGERRGVKEMLVFVRDYYRVGVIGGGEREKLKRYFFSREFSGFTGFLFFFSFFFFLFFFFLSSYSSFPQDWIISHSSKLPSKKFWAEVTFPPSPPLLSPY